MKRYTVVVAEDEPWIRGSIVRKINASTRPFSVVGEASDGDHALTLVHELGPDVLFTDIRMPERSGIEIASTLRNAYPALQVIIVTGYDEFTYARDAIRTGVVDFLVKPVDEAELDRALDRAMEALEIEFAAADARVRHESDRVRSSEDVIARLREIITERLTEALTVAELARAIGYSPDHLTRIVGRQLGMTTTRYIAEIRIREAMRLLRAHPSVQIGEIGPLVGLPDPAHFSRTFKNVSGMSPGQYRARNR